MVLVWLGTVETFGLVITHLSLGTRSCASYHSQEEENPLISCPINTAHSGEVVSGAGNSISCF